MQELVEKHRLPPHTHFLSPIIAVFTSSLFFQVPLVKVHKHVAGGCFYKGFEKKLDTSLVPLTFFGFNCIYTKQQGITKFSKSIFIIINMSF